MVLAAIWLDGRKKIENRLASEEVTDDSIIVRMFLRRKKATTENNIKYCIWFTAPPRGYIVPSPPTLFNLLE